MNFGVVVGLPRFHRMLRVLTGVKNDGKHPDMGRGFVLCYRIPPENKEPKWEHTFDYWVTLMQHSHLCNPEP